VEKIEIHNIETEHCKIDTYYRRRCRKNPEGLEKRKIKGRLEESQNKRSCGGE
jgi:hypothetical protein